MFKVNSSRSRYSRRRGAVAIWGLVCLILATSIAATLCKLAVTGSQVILKQQRHTQCEMLVESGWSLAKSKLGEDPQYRGETWEIPSDQLGGSEVGQVIIEVNVLPDQAANKKERQVRIQARFPKDSPRQIRITTSKLWKPES